MIKILKNDAFEDLKINNLYLANFYLLRKCDEKLLDKIYESNNGNNKKYSIDSNFDENLSDSDETLTYEELEITDDDNDNSSIKKLTRCKSI